MTSHRETEGDAEDHDLGLAHDLPRLLTRRHALSALGILGLGATGLGLAACGNGTAPAAGSGNAPSGPPPGSASGASGGADGGTVVGDSEIPEETAGPYPADGSNGVDVLSQSGVVRSDIRSSFGDASGTATGVPLAIELTVIDLQGSDRAPLEGAAVYLWHCDSTGRYSMYSSGIESENYLRGVQVSDADGLVRLISIYPGCYSGRWPHVHFEVYPSVDDATAAANRLRTSQMALPQETSEAVYARSDYGDSSSNLAQSSLSSDMVFSDGYSLQMAKVTGEANSGYTARLNVPV